MKPDNTNLGAMLDAEVPSAGADYWSHIDEMLAGIAQSGPATHGEVSSGDEHGQDITTGILDASDPRSSVRQSRVWIGIAAAIVCLIGLFAFTQLAGRTQDELGSVSEVERLEFLPGPRQNLDHWNAVYGVWDCSANNGDGAWLPKFESTDDDFGVHSHGDGLISIHPFFDYSSAQNATFDLFLISMGVTVTDSLIKFDDYATLTESKDQMHLQLDGFSECDGEPVVHLRRWQSVLDLVADPDLPPRIITDSIGNERFYNDLEVWVLAFAPVDAELPPLPADRIAAINRWLPD